MKGLMFYGFWLCVLFSSAVYSQNANVKVQPSVDCITIEVFSRQGCPHCKAAYEALNDLTALYPQLTVIKRQVIYLHYHIPKRLM